MFNSWNHAFRTIGFLGCFPNRNPAWCWEQHGWLTWSYHIFPINRCPGFMTITPSLLPFSIVLSTQRFSNCSSTVDVGFVKLSLDCFCVNRVFKMNNEFSCHLCRSSSVTFKHHPLQHMAIPFTQFRFSATIPLSWWCLPMICTCYHNPANWCSLQLLQLNVHQQSVLFENLTSLPICSTFIQTVTKHNLFMHSHRHYTV